METLYYLNLDGIYTGIDKVEVDADDVDYFLKTHFEVYPGKFLKSHSKVYFKSFLAAKKAALSHLRYMRSECNNSYRNMVSLKEEK